MRFLPLFFLGVIVAILPAGASAMQARSDGTPMVYRLPIDAEGYPISTNPVWNACVRGVGLSFDLIQSNRDTFVHRQGRVRKFIPWSCRDYHRGPQNVWRYSDDLDLQLSLDRSGKFLFALSEKFVVPVRVSSFGRARLGTSFPLKVAEFLPRSRGT